MPDSASKVLSTSPRFVFLTSKHALVPETVNVPKAVSQPVSVTRDTFPFVSITINGNGEFTNELLDEYDVKKVYIQKEYHLNPTNNFDYMV